MSWLRRATKKAEATLEEIPEPHRSPVAKTLAKRRGILVPDIHRKAIDTPGL